MKKILSLILILVLCFTAVSCTQKKAEVPENIVNPVNVTISITDSDGDELVAEDFTPVEKTPFIVEEGTNVLDATQIFCISNDIDVEIGASGDYIASLNGLSEKDIEPTTGWIFKINGEAGSLSAKDEVLVEGDEISWEFVDFTTYSW